MKIKNTTIESAPYIDLEITFKNKTVQEVRCYWSQNSGTYGHQVCWQSWNNMGEKTIYNEGKTSGCGYCKESDGFAYALRSLGYQYKHNALNSLRRPPYQKGGNLVKISVTALKRELKSTTC